MANIDVGIKFRPDAPSPGLDIQVDKSLRGFPGYIRVSLGPMELSFASSRDFEGFASDLNNLAQNIALSEKFA